MALTKLTTDLNIVSALADLPNATSGLTAAQLKAKFDEGPKGIQEYINDILTVELESQFETKTDLTTNRKLSDTGDFTGTLNGYAIVAADPGLSSTVAGHTAQLADIAINAKSLGILPNTNVSDVCNTALNNLADGTTVLFNGTYLFDKPIYLSKSLKFKTGSNAIFKFADTFEYDQGGVTLKMFEISADGVEFEGITFDGGVVTPGTLNNIFILNNNGRFRALGCNFYSLPSGGSNLNGSICLVSSGSGKNIVDGCYFEDCPGSVFTQQKYDIINNCVSINPTDASYALNSSNCIGSTVSNCKVIATDTCSLHIGVEQGVKDFTLIDNYVKGVKNGIGIGCLSVSGNTSIGGGGKISGNIIDGDGLVTTSPTAGLFISPYYDDVLVTNNTIKNIGTGNSSSAAVSISVSNIKLVNNIISSNTDQTIIISADVDRTKTLTIENNEINGLTNTWGIRFGAGSLTNSVVKFIDNLIKGSSEGINTLNLSAISDLFMVNNVFQSVTSAVNISNIYGAWLTYVFNLDGAQYNHQISKTNKKEFVVSNANFSAPSSGVFRARDKINNVTPVAGGYESLICTTGGTSGTWKGAGLIQA